MECNTQGSLMLSKSNLCYLLLDLAAANLGSNGEWMRMWFVLLAQYLTECCIPHLVFSRGTKWQLSENNILCIVLKYNVINRL